MSVRIAYIPPTDARQASSHVRMCFAGATVGFSMLCSHAASARPEAPPPAPESSPAITVMAITRAPTLITYFAALGGDVQAAVSGIASSAAPLASIGANLSALEASHCASAHAAAAVNDAIGDAGLTPTRLTIREDAQRLLDVAASARFTATDSLRQIMVEVLLVSAGPESLLLLQRMESNTNRPVLDAFKCLDLSEDGWQVLQTALRKTERGLTLTPDESEALAGAHSNPLVQTVAQRIATNGPALEAWFAEHAHTAAASTSGPAQ